MRVTFEWTATNGSKVILVQYLQGDIRTGMWHTEVWSDTTLVHETKAKKYLTCTKRMLRYLKPKKGTPAAEVYAQIIEQLLIQTGALL